MVQLCPRCQHSNPAEAAYCHFDGALLRQGAEPPRVGFLQEFVFPAGRRCRTFDELVQACYQEWDDARGMLLDGTFEGFLASLGRADLARAAREAKAMPDADIALTNFLSSLPATQAEGPKLGINPRRLLLGPFRVGEVHSASLFLSNEGQGVLQGKVTVGDGDGWLQVDDVERTLMLPMKSIGERPVHLRIDTAGLVVGQSYAAKLVLMTNGGVAEVPVGVELVARPFMLAPFQGAASPHELARKMRDQPHPAVPLLESGDVARWFASNGWTYPIVGASAPGLAAVQQFFEELGLARAPTIEVAETELTFTCTVPEVKEGKVVLQSPARKLVYGRAESDAAWLVVRTPSVSGKVQAEVGFAIDSAQMPEDKTYHGSLKVVANAGQTFPVRVKVEVKGNKRGWFGGRKPPSVAVPAAPPPSTVVDAASSVPSLPEWVPPASLGRPRAGKKARAGSVGEMVFAGVLLALVLRLVLVFPVDIYARLLNTTTTGPVAGTLPAWGQMPLADEGFLKHLAIATWWLGAGVGVLVAWRGGGRWTDLLCGVLAGAVAGLAAGATLGCAVVLGDALPRWVLSLVAGRSEPGVGLATTLWVVTATLCWAAAGGVLGLMLTLLGRVGRRAMTWLASPLRGALGFVGLRKAAALFELTGDT